MRSRSVGTLGSIVGLLCLALPPTAPTATSDSPVADAAQQGDMTQVRALLRQGAEVNAPQGDGMTALHWAAEENDTLLANVLLYAGADVSADTRIGHYTPLHVASQAGNYEVAEVLLSAGADPEARTTTTGCVREKTGRETGTTGDGRLRTAVMLANAAYPRYRAKRMGSAAEGDAARTASRAEGRQDRQGAHGDLRDRRAV